MFPRAPGELRGQLLRNPKFSLPFQSFFSMPEWAASLAGPGDWLSPNFRASVKICRTLVSLTFAGDESGGNRLSGPSEYL